MKVSVFPNRCRSCLKKVNERECIAYTEFIGDGCLGYVDKPDDMVAMYAVIVYYAEKVGSVCVARRNKDAEKAWLRKLK